MKKIFILLISFCCITLFGQTPTITINLPSNPSADTSTWGTGSNIFNIFVAGSNLNMLADGTVLVNIKSNGSVKCGSANASSAQPTNMNGNTPKSWIGTAAQGLIGQDCVLTPGSYEVCVQFYGYNNGGSNVVLLEKCVPFNIPDQEQQICSPPINVNPTDDKIFTDKDLTSILTFNWSPVVSSYRGIITYRLFVWEVEEGQTNAQAIYNNQPIIQEDIKGQPRYIARPGILEKRNAKYVWRVVALDAEGNPICKTAQSEPTTFVIEIPVVISNCIDFEGQYNVRNWVPFFLTLLKIQTDVPHKNYLQIADGSGPSIAVNYTEFAGNWLEKGKNGCLCFDYMVDWEGPLNNATRSPNYFLYHGPPISTSGSRLDFGTSYYRAWLIPNPTLPLIKDTEWGKFCLPIQLSKNGQLPSNSYGQWQVIKDGVIQTGAAACTAWDYLIQNVTGFCLGSDYNSSPSEFVSFDNFCWTCEEKQINTPETCCDENTKEGCLIIDKSKMTIICNGFDKNGKPIYKVSGITLKNLSKKKAKTGLTSNTSGTNYVTPDPTGSFVINNTVPISVNPIASGNEIDISFDISQVLGTSISFNIDASLISKELVCDKSFPIKIEKLPECESCQYCLDDKKSNIKTGTNTVTVTPLNIMNISQDFNISPKNIKRITAEIISFEEDPVSEKCMKCASDESWVNKFISHNTASWNSGMAMNGSPVNSAGYYPTSLVEWHCNKQGNLKLDFKIVLAAPENGCNRKGKVGIRYSFTDIDCITCEKIIYYNYNSK